MYEIKSGESNVFLRLDGHKGKVAAMAQQRPFVANISFS